MPRSAHRNAKKVNPADDIHEELDAVKKLLILLLLKLGSTSDEIGTALGVAPSLVRRWVPSTKVKKIINNK